MKKRLLAWVLSFALALSLLPVGVLAAEGEVVASGFCGDHQPRAVSWVLDETGKLTISGTGDTSITGSIIHITGLLLGMRIGSRFSLL